MKKIIKYLFTIFAVIALAAPNSDAAEEKYSINFQDAHELMMNNNNAIKLYTEKIEEKKYKKRAALGHFSPKFALSATFLHFNKDISTETSSVNIGGTSVPIQNITIQNKDVGGLGFTALWNVFTGGRILALNKAARAEYLASNLQFRATSNALTAKLTELYYGLVLTQEVLKVREMVRDMTSAHLEDAKKMEREGLIAKSERLHAEVAYKKALKDYDAAKKDIAIMDEGVKNLIKDESVKLSNISLEPTSRLFMPNNDPDDLEALKVKALENNPEYKQNDTRKQLAQASYNAQFANYLPTVSLFAYDVTAQYNLAQQLPRFGVGASVNFMLFDGLTRYNELKAADSVRKQAKYAEILARNNIESKVVQDYLELLKAKEEWQNTEKSLESAQESLRCATLAFKEGLGTSLSVIDAQTSYAAIKIQRLNALYRYDVKLAQLLADTGDADKIFEYIENSLEETI